MLSRRDCILLLTGFAIIAVGNVAFTWRQQILGKYISSLKTNLMILLHLWCRDYCSGIADCLGLPGKLVKTNVSLDLHLFRQRHIQPKGTP